MDSFIHETRGRRPVTLAALAMCLTVGIVSLANGLLQDEAGWWVGTIWLATIALLGWMVIADPRTGIEIRDDGIAWWNDRRSGFVTRNELDRFEIVEWSDSTDYNVVLKDGSRVSLHGIVNVDHEAVGQALARRGMGFDVR